MINRFIAFCRENEQIVGSYLEIEDITLEDYGEYECRVSNGVDDEMTLPAHIYRQGNNSREDFASITISLLSYAK